MSEFTTYVASRRRRRWPLVILAALAVMTVVGLLGNSYPPDGQTAEPGPSVVDENRFMFGSWIRWLPAWSRWWRGVFRPKYKLTCQVW